VNATAAAAWAALAASSLPIGCGLTLWLRPSRRLVALTMGFGAGALISAASYELVLEAVAVRGPVVLGMAAGAGTFFAADALVDRRGGEHRKRVAPRASVEGSGQAIFLGTLLDGIPESFVLGVSLVSGGTVSAAFLVAVFVSNLPEAVAATWSLHAAGWRNRRIVTTWSWVVVVSAAAGLAGYLVVSAVPSADGAFAQAFAAGAVLVMLTDSMMPEAFDHGGRAAGLLVVAGFVVASSLIALE
jgi:ZIP family zinc transporter